MARWQSGGVVTGGRNRYGGVVFTGKTGQNILRVHALPTRANGAGTTQQQKTIQTAQSQWQNMTGGFNVDWTILASWIKFLGGSPFGQWISPLPFFNGCWSNAALLGTVPSIPLGVAPPVPPPIIFAEIQLVAGVITATAYGVGPVVYTGPWLMFVTLDVPSILSPQPKNGTLFVGGSISGAPVDITAAWVLAFGQLPVVGLLVAMQVYPLYPVCFWAIDPFLYVTTVQP
jgi:hypothetical protein